MRSSRLHPVLLAVLALAPSTAAGAAGQPSTREVVERVRVPFPQDDGSLTPYTFELGYPLMTLVYDTLLWRDAEGRPQPWLARSVVENEDGRQLTVRLAEGVTWHDGQPVTAEDVAFTFRYVAERPHPRFTPELADVERVDVIDPTTVVISLRRPVPGFSDQPLADLPILPAHLWRDLPVDRPAPEGLPIGSGPYRLTSYQPGQSWRFEANAQYFRGAPVVRVIEVPVIRDAEETLRAFERRRVDMVPVSLPAAAATRLSSLSTTVARGPSYLGTVLMFNLRRAPFDNVAVRRAVSQALDPTALARAVGAAVPADRGYLHPGSVWAAPVAPPAPSPTEALPIGPIRVLAPDNDPVKLATGRQVVSALNRAGATAELVRMRRDELSRAVGEDGSPPSFELAIWTAPPLASYDPGFLARLFGSSGPSNLSGYRSSVFDEAADRVISTRDPAARRTAVADALGALATDVPVVPLFFSDGAFAFRPAVFDGWVYVRGTGILDKRSFVEPAAGQPPTVTPTEVTGQPDDGSFPFGWAAVGVLVVAGLLGLGLTARGRGRRRGPAGGGR